VKHHISSFEKILQFTNYQQLFLLSINTAMFTMFCHRSRDTVGPMLRTLQASGRPSIVISLLV